MYGLDKIVLCNKVLEVIRTPSFNHEANILGLPAIEDFNNLKVDFNRHTNKFNKLIQI